MKTLCAVGWFGAAGQAQQSGDVAAALSNYGLVTSGVYNTTGLSGILQAAQFPALTGDVTTTAGSLATTLSNTSAARGNLGLGSIATQAAGAVAVTGGTINGTAIGGTTAAAGSFTTVNATSAVTCVGMNSSFDVQISVNGKQLAQKDPGGTYRRLLNLDGGNNLQVGDTGSAGKIVLNNNGVSTTIDASGNLLVGTASVLAVGSGTANGVNARASGLLVASQNNLEALQLQRTGTTGSVATFWSGSTNVGGVSVTGSATAFNTSSDKRLKGNVAALSGTNAGGNILDQLAPVSYTWEYVAGNPAGTGFLAQDLYAVIPEAVTAGDGGPVGADGTVARQWSVDFSKVVPYLVAEVQSLRLRVAALEARRPPAPSRPDD